MTGQRPWNRIEHTENLMLGPSSVFQNVGAIKVDDRPLFKIDLRKVVLSDEFIHGLRHAANDFVLPEDLENAAMHPRTDRPQAVERIAHDRH